MSFLKYRLYINCQIKPICNSLKEVNVGNQNTTTCYPEKFMFLHTAVEECHAIIAV